MTEFAEADSKSREQLELELLLEAILRRYGYDFRQYARASLLRRVRNAVREERAATISGLQEILLHDPRAIKRFITALSVNVTSMFRDADFYHALRNHALPLLRTYPSIRIWHAGCATGEEVLSMAILLHEEGLYDRCTLYGTDLADNLMDNARQGRFPIRQMKTNTLNYQQAGGKHDFSSYYTATATHARFKPELLRNLYFSAHNLVSDSPFNEFQLVLCRNVMIYFNAELRERVLGLLHASVSRRGVLGIGTKESLRFSHLQDSYAEFVPGSRLYRRAI
jgi:chemotaxis protein methyltransferase CheR